MLRDGIVSVTPLHLALTANEMRPLVETWPVQGVPTQAPETQPPLTAGRIAISAPSRTGVSSPPV